MKIYFVQIDNWTTAHFTTAQITFFNCTFQFYNCTNCDQLHVKICPVDLGILRALSNNVCMFLVSAFLLCDCLSVSQSILFMLFMLYYVRLSVCLSVCIQCSVGRGWRIGRVDAFRPKGHGFDFRSSRHTGTLDKSLTHNCLWRFGVKFRHSIRAVSGAPLSSSRLEAAL